MAAFKGDWRYQRCDKCGNPINEQTVRWCKEHPEKTEGKALCWECQPSHFDRAVKNYR